MLFSLGAPFSCLFHRPPQTSAGLSSLSRALTQVLLLRSPALIQVTPSRLCDLFIASLLKLCAQLIAALLRPRSLIQVAPLRLRALFHVAPSRSCTQLIAAPLRPRSHFKLCRQGCLLWFIIALSRLHAQLIVALSKSRSRSLFQVTSLSSSAPLCTHLHHHSVLFIIAPLHTSSSLRRCALIFIIAPSYTQKCVPVSRDSIWKQKTVSLLHGTVSSHNLTFTDIAFIFSAINFMQG